MVAKAYRLLRAILNTAVDDDIVDRNPCRIRGGGDEKAPERPTLSVVQVQQLAMLVPPRWSAFITVKAFGALRWGEITALRRCDVDLDGGSVRVRAAYVELSDGSLELGEPKSSASKRPVSLPTPVVEMLRRPPRTPTSRTSRRRWCSPDPADARCGAATSTKQ